MEAKIDKGTLIVTIPVTEGRPSSTGKSYVIASTGGFQGTTLIVSGKPVKINLTAIIPSH
jgi:hypothetical protein